MKMKECSKCKCLYERDQLEIDNVSFFRKKIYERASVNSVYVNKYRVVTLQTHDYTCKKCLGYNSVTYKSDVATAAAAGFSKRYFAPKR
jgi:hypothetical protein